MNQLNQLNQLRQFSTVVADTGQLAQIAQYRPRDATTNPSLLLKAMQSPEGPPLLARVTRQYPAAKPGELAEHLLVACGVEILRLIPGRVSTEIDPRLSFDTEASVACAQRLMVLYAAAGIPAARVLIKIAATWEGIQAARALALQGIHTNLTLVFNLAQAQACADAGVRLISPFVGRIYDWHKKAAGEAWVEGAMAGANDPGVRSVAQIYAYYKAHGIGTEVMAASFRNTGQILALAGCDLMTISPNLLAELAQSEAPFEAGLLPLSATEAADSTARPTPLSRADFDQAMAADAMAREKLGEGIAQFVADTWALEALIQTPASTTL